MKILYGIQTTGNGHIVRSKSMIRELTNRGHEVHALFSGCNNKTLLDPASFGSFEQKNGLTFVVENGRIRYLKTACQLDFFSFYRDISSFKANGYDLVITDYEPLTARIARKNRIPSIGIGHLYAFRHKVPLPGKNFPAKWIMNNYAPVQYALGLHWHHFDQPILPPTIPADVLGLQRRTENNAPFFLVYLPFEKLDVTVRTLNRLHHHRFRLYAGADAPEQRGNVAIRPLSRRNFIEDLAACSGAICNSGFSFISEALHLGVKILTKPVGGQIEQQANAMALQKLKLGSVTTAITADCIDQWSTSCSPPPLNCGDVLPLVAQWIDSGNYDDNRELIEACWASRPPPVPEVLAHR